MQKREAWCRGCGENGDYPSGWSLISAEDFAALRNGARAPISGMLLGNTGRYAVRLRLRNLACRTCGAFGQLVSGRARVVAVFPKRN